MSDPYKFTLSLFSSHSSAYSQLQGSSQFTKYAQEILKNVTCSVYFIKILASSYRDSMVMHTRVLKTGWNCFQSRFIRFPSLVDILFFCANFAGQYNNTVFLYSMACKVKTKTMQLVEVYTPEIKRMHYEMHLASIVSFNTQSVSKDDSFDATLFQKFKKNSFHKIPDWFSFPNGTNFFSHFVSSKLT